MGYLHLMRLVWAWLGLGSCAVVACNAVNGLGDYAFDLGNVGGSAGSTTSSSTSAAGGDGGTGGTGGTPSCGPCEGTCTTELMGFDERWVRLSDLAADTPTLESDPGGDIVVLTTAAQYKQGTVFWPQPIVTAGFTARFEVRVSEPGMPAPGDGMAFVAQQASPQTPGEGLSGFGLTRTSGTEGVLFELDTYDNGVECDDTDPHIGLSGLDTTIENVNCDRTPRQIASQNIAGLIATSWYTVDVEVTPAAGDTIEYRMSIALDGGSPVEISGTEPAAGLFDPNAPHYFGFGAGTGQFFERHEVRNVVITFPEAICLE